MTVFKLLKNNFFKILLFTLTLTISTTTLADQTPADNSAGNNLPMLLENLKTYQADFDQIITAKNNQLIQESTGKMALERPGHFRWETLKPNQQLIIADGKFIWIFDKDLQQVTQKKQTGNTQSPALLLSDSVENLQKRFTISTLDTNHFKLLPIKKDLFKSVELFFDSQNKLTHMILNDNLGQITTIQFNHALENQEINTNLFKFHPPKNIDIIKG